MTDWRPTASPDALALRAGLYAYLRVFLAERGVLEVETPIASRAGNTDANIDSFIATSPAPRANAQPLWLRTSPEFPLKRLLAAGVGDCYELGRVFRYGEAGRRHNPEFTMLEWYRVGWDHRRLMDEVADLVVGALASSLAACSKTRPPTSSNQGSVDAPLPQRVLPALEDDPDAPDGLYEAFAAIGTVDLGRFQGAYAYPSELGPYPGLSIERNVLRSGAIPRTEIAPVRVVDRDADELLAVAVVHEDIDDPGDASLAYLLLRAEPDGGIFVSLGETAAELWDAVSLDELYQERRWGADSEAQRARARREADWHNAARFLSLL